jgi:GxxExxY protein
MDCAFKVHRHLGPGFKERIYQEALCLELHATGLSFEREKPIDVIYCEWRIPGQRIDLLVAEKVLVEVKAVPRLRPIHKRHVLSYLKTMNLRIGLVVNFSCGLLKDGFKRVIN